MGAYLLRMERLVVLPLFCGKSSRTVGREQLMCWTCGVREEAEHPVIGPCCFSQGNVSGRAGLAGACAPICSSSGSDCPIGSSVQCSRGAIGEAGLHMQMTWKWHKHVDTRIGFISAAGWKVKPGLAVVILQAFLGIISSGWWCLTWGMSVSWAALLKAQSAISGTSVRVNEFAQGHFGRV